jgi:hypothetical protein
LALPGWHPRGRHYRCLGHSQQGSAAGSCRLHPAAHCSAGSSRSRSGRRYSRCWVLQVSIRRRHDRRLGRSQQGGAAGSSRSRSGRRYSCCWVLQVSIRGATTAALGAANKAALLNRPGLDPGAPWSLPLGAANKAARLGRPMLSGQPALARPIQAASETHRAELRRSIDARARPAWSPTKLVRACTK